MVMYNPRQWFTLIFHAYSRRVMKRLMPALIFMAVYTTLICYIFLDYFKLHQADFQPTVAMHSLLGIVLGLFLVFRTNTAYDRWWEGRRLWGGMVNSTRNFALKLNAYLQKGDFEEREWFAKMIPNFVYASKEHLRKGVQFAELEDTDDQMIEYLKKYKHRPNQIAGLMYSRVNDLYRKNVITGNHLINLDKELKDFIDLIGACERIKNTPIPYSYTMYIKKFIFIYIITLPFGFISTFEYFTIATVLLVSFVLLSVELIAEEIEDPFGKDINDLPAPTKSRKVSIP